MSVTHSPPLFIAIKNGDLAKVQELIAAGADVNEQVKGGIFSIYGKTPLHYASELGKADIVAALVAAGADLNKLSLRDGQTALMISALRGYLDTVNALLAAGADINIRCPVNHLNALEFAAYGQQIEVVRRLMDVGARVLPNTYILAEICKGNPSIEIVKALVAAGADVNYFTPLNELRPATGVIHDLPLSHAAHNTPLMAALIELGADINKKRQWSPPLAAAVAANNVSGVRLLLAAGAKHEMLDDVFESRHMPMVHTFIDSYLEHGRPLTPDVIDKAKRGKYLPAINALVLDYERLAMEKRRKPVVNAWVRRRHAPGNTTRKAQLEEQVGNLLKYKTMNERFAAEQVGNLLEYKTMNEHFAAAIKNAKFRRSKTRRSRKSRR